jgi:hypothetical protein
VTLQLRLEQLARSLAGKRTDKGAQRVVTIRLELVSRVRASTRPMFPPPLAPMPSSFGHDTPVERRYRLRVLVLLWMGTECGSDASSLDRHVAVTVATSTTCLRTDLRLDLRPKRSPIGRRFRGRVVERRDDQEVKLERETNRGLRPAIRVAPHQAMRRGLRVRNRRREFDNSAVGARRQEVHARPSIIALLRFADRAVKAASRAYAPAKQRGAP